MRILSLFDGCSVAQQALKELNIDVEYYSSEIDKYAINITQKNHPNTIQLGDVTKIKEINNIDLLIGGSPCQDLSIAKSNRKGLSGPKSGLFWEYIRILKETNPRYFVLENVNSMSKIDKDIITKILKIEPIMVNASLVSAQNRKRLFWTNIQNIIQPIDKGIILKDILEHGQVDRLKSYCIDASYYKGGNLNTYIKKSRRQIVYDNNSIRKLTPIECERLQSLPDNYTYGVSNTQRYKMLGNAFNCEVIKHILRNINV
jgi:site-specific DNA-cytosine methylase